MKFILHVWTTDPSVTPWAVHVIIEGEEELLLLTKEVKIDVPSHTRSEGHRPCADWYIECEANGYNVGLNHEWVWIA